jgi:hypothetical protein
VNWKEHRKLATALRDQGLIDFLAARFALRPVDLKFSGQPITFAHIAVAKSQQSIEKLTKGFLLWDSPGFDPTKGHAPFTTLLSDQTQRKAFARFFQSLNTANHRLVKEIKWLESLAPKPPMPEGPPGDLQELRIIELNTEYPFWSVAQNRLVSTAEGITLESHGLKAIRTARDYLGVLAESSPREYCDPIREFLQTFPVSVAISAWPE